MNNYLIEFRFQGLQKNELKKMISGINRKFKIFPKNRPVPHITIVAPFKTNKQKRLVNDFKKICKQFNLMRFNINSFGVFDNSRVVYVNIKPSKEMILFRKKLLSNLNKYCNLCKTDISKFFIFTKTRKYFPHATLAMKLNPSKFQKIKSFIFKQKPIKKRYTLLRATLMKERKILYEYDFALNKLLNRKEAKSRSVYSQSIKKLKSK